MVSLKVHLQQRLGSAHRRLRESLEGLSEAEAVHHARGDWRRYRFGTGLDGSIAGIVRHVAVWKHAAFMGLQSGTFPDPENLLLPSLSMFDVLAWLSGGQAGLVGLLEQLPEAELERTVTWEGHEMPLHVLLAHMIEHDQYHTGQINLLRQQLGHDLS